MIKCLECGKEAMRLQWTHFKYQCTGKFNNGKEYMEAHPAAKVVDESLAKKTAITKDNMIAKYGDLEGNRRWDRYREKQSVSNSIAYKKEKHGWNTQDFEAFNKSRAVTMLSMIEKYGEEIGIMKWDQYREKQRYTNGVEYFIDKYGTAEGPLKWEELNKEKAKATSIPHIAEKYNVTFDEATDDDSSVINAPLHITDSF